jgi:hypothetical protein
MLIDAQKTAALAVQHAPETAQTGRIENKWHPGTHIFSTPAATRPKTGATKKEQRLTETKRRGSPAAKMRKFRSGEVERVVGGCEGL